MGDEIGHDLPYRAEYAKSNRSSCKGCKSGISQGSLRLAIMVQSPMFDGKVPNWHHPKCFFLKARPKTVGDIGHFDSLRWEDQESIKKLMESAASGAIGGKGGKGKAAKNGTAMADFRTEYAKSGGSKCGVCEEKISKGAVRIGKKEYDSDRAKMYGPYDRWHHIDCFIKAREDYEFFAGGEDLAGYNTLSADDKAMLKDKVKPLKAAAKRKADEKAKSADEPDSKKVKKEDEELLKKQNKKMFYYRDLLQKSLSQNQLKDLLESNGQAPAVGVDRMLDRLADIMTFGALLPCPECKEGQFVFRSGIGYQCLGDMSEWSKCNNIVEEPQRKPFIVPQELRDEYDFLRLYKSKLDKRMFQKVAPSSASAASKNGDVKNGSGKILRGIIFVLDSGVDKKAMQAKIEALGGKVSKDVTEKTAAVISSKKQLESKKPSKIVQAAKELKIQAVSEDVLDEIAKEGVLSCIRSKTISIWEANDPKDRISFELESKTKSSFLKSEMSKSVKMKLKGGGFVDPDSKLEDKAHVLKIKEAVLSVVLGAADVATGRNSYYKIQVLEHDKKPKWWVFRAWGRVGTTIGGNKLESFDDRSEAIRLFEFHYEDKTGNRWSNRASFQKVPGKMYPMDIDYGQDCEEIKKIEVATSRSKLPKSVQELMSLIFDIDQMRKTMVEFEIDMTKMPLGKLSRKQIESAYKILTEVLDLIRTDSGSNPKFIDATNRFFTLIPHDFGLNAPPLLDNVDYIKSKIEMLDNLLEIEVAYSLLKTSADESGMDPIDAHYSKLKCDIQVLERETDEFAVIQKYVKQTHAATHSMYSLDIEDIYKIDRKGEATRFKPFKKLHNRMLLWHGSRTTNFAGILSQGLRIAPPEAPVTGYMFGKGIYFADMVSKSANYCQTTRSNNTGLLMLCDVALGTMYERYHADYIEKLPKGMHSVKGVGKTEPNPGEFAELNGAKVPLGMPVKTERFETDKNLRGDLLYNEYIVYDVAQVKAQYLVKTKFNYKI